MIGHHDIALVFQSAVSIAVLGVVLLKFWSEARLDTFRQQMFAIRDELFDYAAAENISFDNPAYRLLRRSMNGFIRYGHQLTFFRICATALELKLAGKSTESTWFEDWESALKKIQDNGVRLRLNEFHDLAMVCAANRLIFGSPVLLLLVVCSVPVLILRMGWLNLKLILEKAPLFTVSHVIGTRMIENQAAAAAVA